MKAVVQLSVLGLNFQSSHLPGKVPQNMPTPFLTHPKKSSWFLSAVDADLVKSSKGSGLSSTARHPLHL